MYRLENTRTSSYSVASTEVNYVLICFGFVVKLRCGSIKTIILVLVNIIRPRFTGTGKGFLFSPVSQGGNTKLTRDVKFVSNVNDIREIVSKKNGFFSLLLPFFWLLTTVYSSSFSTSSSFSSFSSLFRPALDFD